MLMSSTECMKHVVVVVAVVVVVVVVVVFECPFSYAKVILNLSNFKGWRMARLSKCIDGCSRKMTMR